MFVVFLKDDPVFVCNGEARAHTRFRELQFNSPGAKCRMDEVSKEDGFAIAQKVQDREAEDRRPQRAPNTGKPMFSKPGSGGLKPPVN